VDRRRQRTGSPTSHGRLCLLCGAALLPWLLACGGAGTGGTDAIDDVAQDAVPADVPDVPSPDVPTDLPPLDSPDVPDVLDVPSDLPSPDSPDAPDVPAPLYRVDGPRIVDRAGRTLFLRGINVASGDLVAWAADEPDVESHVFHHVAESGFDAVRFVVNWDRTEPVEGQIDTAYLDVVERQVRTAAAEGLYVVIDMHQDMYGIGFGNHGAPDWSCDQVNYDAFQPIEPWFFNYYSAPVSACFDHFWKTHDVHAHQQEAARRIAERVADVDLVLGFDPINEPFPGTIDPDAFDSEYLYPFHAEFAAAVGASLPGRLYFIEPAVTFSASLTCLLPGPITAFQAVFAPHYYNPSVEMQKVWDGDPGAVSTAVQAAADVATALRTPLAYGEMGGDRATPNLSEYLDDLFGELDARGAGSFLWIYSRGTVGFGMIDSATGTWTSASRAYLRPAPARVGGVLASYAWSIAKRRMVMAWQDDGRNDTEVILPAWVRDAGYACTVDGAPFAPSPAPTGPRLVIPASPAGPRTFTMTVAADTPG